MKSAPKPLKAKVEKLKKLEKDLKDINKEKKEFTNKNKYVFPEGYKELFNKSYEIFMMYKDKLNVSELEIHKSTKDTGKLINFMVDDIEMNELRVQKAIKKIQNSLNV